MIIKWEGLRIVHIHPTNNGIQVGLDMVPFVASNHDGRLYQLHDVSNEGGIKADDFHHNDYQEYTGKNFKENVNFTALPHYVPVVLSKPFIEMLRETGINENISMGWRPLPESECLFAYVRADKAYEWQKNTFWALALWIKNKLAVFMNDKKDSEKILFEINKNISQLYYLYIDHDGGQSRRLLKSLVLLIAKLQKKMAGYERVLEFSIQQEVFADRQSAETSIAELETEIKNMAKP